MQVGKQDEEEKLMRTMTVEKAFQEFQGEILLPAGVGEKGGVRVRLKGRYTGNVWKVWLLS